jgi:YHS domain-containing protein
LRKKVNRYQKRIKTIIRKILFVIRGPAVKAEHEGKIYNLCCAGCISEFKNSPEKYIKIIEEEIKDDM